MQAKITKRSIQPVEFEALDYGDWFVLSHTDAAEVCVKIDPDHYVRFNQATLPKRPVQLVSVENNPDVAIVIPVRVELTFTIGD